MIYVLMFGVPVITMLVYIAWAVEIIAKDGKIIKQAYSFMWVR